MRRAHARWRLRAARIINDDAVLAPIHRQTITVGCALFGIFDVGRIALQDRNFVHGRVLTPIAGAALAGLNQHDVALRDYLLKFVNFLLQINVGHARRHAISSLLDIDVGFVVHHPLGI